jgi:hypothetical protein
MKDLREAPVIDPALVEGISVTPDPINKYVEFGAKIPTPFVLKYKGRKSRVFEARYPDFKRFWIRNDRKQIFLDDKTVNRLFKEGRDG